MSESAAKLSCEMSVVVKAARVGNLTDGLPRVQQGSAMQQTRGMIQTDRKYETSTGRIPHSEELLKISKRDPHFGRDLARTKRVKMEMRVAASMPGEIRH
jgi:hypothetical protein